MAKFLAYNRADQQVVTVNTLDVQVETLGNTIAGAEILSDFPNRSENLVCQFQGDYYFLYRHNTNEIRLSLLDLAGLTWADVPGFTPITTGSGNLRPLGLHVVKDRLVALWTLANSAGIDGVGVRRSAADDGASWSPQIAQNFATQPTNSYAGASVTWHNAVFFTTAEGIGYYDPAGDTLSATYDSGDDAGITGQIANFGSFSYFENDLYYVLATDDPVGSPSLYKLDKSWSVSTPIMAPAWSNTLIVIPAIGEVIVNNDTGNYSLAVNRAGVLSLFYSGALGSKVVTIAKSGSSYVVTDRTDADMPDTLSTEPNLGFSYFVDDRRRSNELHTVVVRFRPSIPQAILLFSWDGASTMTQTGTLDDGGGGLDLMLPEVERGEFRTFTDNQPSCYISDASQPFPGRVRIDYGVRDKSSRTVDVIPEYSLDGQTWSDMTQGDGDSGTQDLATTPSGVAYFFHWDAFVDLDGDFDNVDIRIVARISGV